MAAESFEEDIEIQHLNDEYELETAVNDAMYLYERLLQTLFFSVFFS